MDEMTIRFGKILRENNTRFLFDFETVKEYPLTIETCISLLNHLNNEILNYENMLIELAEFIKDFAENHEGLLLGDVPTAQFKTIVEVMNRESKLHKESNKKMYDEFGAFDNEGKLK